MEKKQAVIALTGAFVVGGFLMMLFLSSAPTGAVGVHTSVSNPWVGFVVFVAAVAMLTKIAFIE